MKCAPLVRRGSQLARILSILRIRTEGTCNVVKVVSKSLLFMKTAGILRMSFALVCRQVLIAAGWILFVRPEVAQTIY